MKELHRLFLVLTIVLGLALSACGAAQIPVTGEEEKPAKLEPIEGTDLNRITLSQEAADRLGLEITSVSSEKVDGADRLVIPYTALLYDPSGQAWVYVNVGPLTFMRAKISVDFIDGDKVILSEGPEAGANVVTLGATELFGSESEFEEE